jgi:phosphoribosylformylglycinamidine synthase
VAAAPVGTSGGDRLTLPGGEAISLAELDAAREGWLPRFMVGEVL